jgi:hypothetical protein
MFLPQQRAFSTILMIDMIFLGSGAVFMAIRLLSAYVGGSSQLVRQRVRVVTLGTLFAFGIPGSVLLISVLTWGEVAMNIAGFTPFLFAVSLAYAIVKHDLLEIDAMVKRGAYYLLLTGAVGAAYLGAIVVFNSLLKASAVTDSPAFPVLFTFAVLLIFNPLRTRLQAFVDRVFFRTRYDGAQVLAEVGAELSSALLRDQIVSLVRSCVDQAIPNAGTRVCRPDRRGRERGRSHARTRRAAADGRVVTAFDPPERYANWRRMRPCGSPSKRWPPRSRCRSCAGVSSWVRSRSGPNVRGFSTPPATPSSCVRSRTRPPPRSRTRPRTKSSPR